MTEQHHATVAVPTDSLTDLFIKGFQEFNIDPKIVSAITGHKLFKLAINEQPAYQRVSLVLVMNEFFTMSSAEVPMRIRLSVALYNDPYFWFDNVRSEVFPFLRDNPELFI